MLVIDCQWEFWLRKDFSILDSIQISLLNHGLGTWLCLFLKPLFLARMVIDFAGDIATYFDIERAATWKNRAEEI